MEYNECIYFISTQDPIHLPKNIEVFNRFLGKKSFDYKELKKLNSNVLLRLLDFYKDFIRLDALINYITELYKRVCKYKALLPTKTTAKEIKSCEYRILKNEMFLDHCADKINEMYKKKIK